MSESTNISCCTLSGSERAERSERWRALGGYEVERLDDGLRLTFAEGHEDELHELARLERACCAFADWKPAGNTIEVTATTAEAIAAVHDLGF